MPAKKSKRKRLVQGKDYHGWAWEIGEGSGKGSFCWFAEAYKPPTANNPTETGKWFRVKYVKVKP